ncbi:ribonuclease H-like domain-containing protein [Tanacetum coccineum]
MMVKNQTMKMHQTLVLHLNNHQPMIPKLHAISNSNSYILKRRNEVTPERILIGKDGVGSSTFTSYWLQDIKLLKSEGKNWEAIRTRFGGKCYFKENARLFQNNNLKKFRIPNSEGLEKGYDRFQQLLSQLEAHGAEVSTEDANHKFLRSLPSAWSNLAMTMRTNPEIILSIVDFKSSTNKVKSGFTGAYSTCTPSTSSTNVPEKEVLAGFADEVIYSLFAKQTEDLDLLHEDLEQIDDVDIEEMDINWQIAMIAIRMKKFYKKTGRRVRVDGKTPVGFDKKKLECFNCHNTGHFAREWFEIQSNDEVLSYEEEMNSFVFRCSKEDSIGKPSYSRFTKTNDFKGVPPPLSGDYTPQPQEEIDALYIYGKKGPQKPEISVSDENSSEHSTCQSNDSEGSCEIFEHSFDCVSHIKTPRQPLKDKETHQVNRKNWNDMMERELGDGYSFTKKKCFVCGSLNHLIKDCDYYERKMAREAEEKRVVNTGNGVTKPVWTNANRINHSNNFVPRSVQLNTCRPKFNSVRPNINTGRTNISSGRPKVNSDRPKVNTVSPKVNSVGTTSNSMSPKRPQMDQINQRRDFSKSYSSVRRPFAKSTAQMAHANAVMGSWGSAVKSSASYNWRNSRPNFNYNSGPTFIRTVNANGTSTEELWLDRVYLVSGCSGHMTGNKDQLEDFEEFNGGSITFGGSKGYISGKGRIRVGNLDFNSVSFVKELGHFNLFSISQIYDKQHKVLFTETECLVVSSDFKMPDENQILLKVPRHHNMYSFDMKTPSPAKGFACLLAKATSDEI